MIVKLHRTYAEDTHVDPPVPIPSCPPEMHLPCHPGTSPVIPNAVRDLRGVQGVQSYYAEIPRYTRDDIGGSLCVSPTT